MKLAFSFTFLGICLHFIFIAVVRADLRGSFDCKMRSLALEYAHYLQPFRSTQAFTDIMAALNGSPEKSPGCNVTLPPSILQALEQKDKHSDHLLLPDSETKSRAGTHSTRFIQPPTISVRSGVTVYADPMHGDDTTGTGSLEKPFKSIARALAATRDSSGNEDTIVLRGGVFYNTSTQVLTRGDSGLTIQAYPGEEPWVSGGILLEGLQWQPYNVSKHQEWMVAQDQNAVYGAGPGTDYIQKTDTWQDCQGLCVHNYSVGGPCTVWTWHDSSTGAYAKQCWFRLDHRWAPTAEKGHISGHLTSGINIWMASLAGKVCFYFGKGEAFNLASLSLVSIFPL